MSCVCMVRALLNLNSACIHSRVLWPLCGLWKSAYACSQGSPSVAPQQRFTARTNSGRPRECHKCRKPLTQIGRPNGHLSDAQQRVAGVEIGGKLYHPECVTCKACGKPITSTQEMHKGGRYHAKCHKKKYGIICDCCHERIEGDVRHASVHSLLLYAGTVAILASGISVSVVTLGPSSQQMLVAGSSRLLLAQPLLE